MNSDKTSHTQNTLMQNTFMLKTDMRKSDTFLKIWVHEVCHFQAYNCTNVWYIIYGVYDHRIWGSLLRVLISHLPFWTTKVT